MRAMGFAAAIWLACAAQPSFAEPLTVTEWVSDRGPLYVRSGIVEGPTEMGLVDTQFTSSNTMRLIADLVERGKPLRWVYVTHPHLDHFNGAALIRAAFPEARFYMPREGIRELDRMVRTRQASLGASAPGGGANLPDEAPRFFRAVPPEGLTIDGERLEILFGSGDHPTSSVVWVPSARTFITGDVVFSETHAFTGDHDDIDAWIALVRRMQALNPARVVVGHGPVDARRSGVVLAEQIAWLEAYRDARRADPRLEAVQARMIERFPGWANEFIFAFSYGVMGPDMPK
jgi:glyoxylase-like metal-dependent hydrolase (beta-lactamase superfamily II)